MAEVAIDYIALIASNPLIFNLLTGIASNAAYDGVKKVVKCLIGHIKRKPEVFVPKQIEQIEAQFASSFERYEKGHWASLRRRFLEEFQQFLFPNRQIDLEHLSEPQCEYIAERLFYGISFQMMLLELGYKKDDVKYMFAFPGRYVRSPYYFDIKAKYEIPFVDQLLVTRIVDSRVVDPIECLQAIPVRIKEINDANPQAQFRDFDLYVIVHTGQYNDSLSQRMKGILEMYRKMESSLPNFTYFKKQELDHLMEFSQKERIISLRQRFSDLKVDRGV